MVPGTQTEFQKTCLEVWNAYKKAYFQKYGVSPVRNAQVNSQIKSLVQRIGKNESAKVVEFYLTHNDSFYVRSMHMLGLCLKDCEKLRTEMLTGIKTNWTTARNKEKSDHWKNQLERIEKGEL